MNTEAHVTTAPFLAVRVGPNKRYPALAELPKGSRIHQVDGEQGWLLIKMPDGRFGWVSSKHTEPAPAPIVNWSRLEWMRAAEGEIGVAEVEGAKHNPRIIEYHRACTLKATEDEIPWCSSFANWVMLQVSIKGTRDARARSWLNWGVAIDEPIFGCIVVFSRPPNPASGHVAFYVGKATNGRIRVLGGNQSNRVSIASYDPGRVLGYRLPA